MPTLRSIAATARSPGSSPIQRAHRRHRGAEIGLLAPVRPVMLLRVDEHMGQVHIVALQRLARRRTLGMREQRVEFLLEPFEVKLL